MVKSAAHYRWSSYQANAQGHDDPLVTEHGCYRALGHNVGTRREAYRALFKVHTDLEQIDAIRSAWQSGTPLGNDRFRATIERTLKTKVGYVKRGRGIYPLLV